MSGDASVMWPRAQRCTRRSGRWPQAHWMELMQRRIFQTRVVMDHRRILERQILEDADCQRMSDCACCLSIACWASSRTTDRMIRYHAGDRSLTGLVLERPRPAVQASQEGGCDWDERMYRPCLVLVLERARGQTCRDLTDPTQADRTPI